MSFEREIRYTVLKHTDITEALDNEETETLLYLEDKIAAFRAAQGKKPLSCVVVETDWPEYKPTWTAIEKRVNTTGE